MRLLKGNELKQLINSGMVQNLSSQRHITYTGLDICLGRRASCETSPPSGHTRTHVLTKGLPRNHLQPIVIPNSGYDLLPWHFILADTEEYFDIPTHIQGIMTLSSWAAQAGLEQSSSLTLKAGWSGILVLELFNSLAVHTLRLMPGSEIAQVQFFDIGEDDDGR